jgi:hypothetical protein
MTGLIPHENLHNRPKVDFSIRWRVAEDFGWLADCKTIGMG